MIARARSRLVTASLFVASTLVPTAPAQQPALGWTDGDALTVEGRGWHEANAPWTRLPQTAASSVRKAVWDLSRHSAGIAIRFVTDASEIHARWSLASDRLAMPHMPATGVSGVDLYARDDGGRWRWVAVGTPRSTANSQCLLRLDGAGRLREFMLYLPLYNEATSVEIGTPEGAVIEPGPVRPEGRRKPIVFYGTSITHGACASRPGTCHTAIVGRRLDRPVVNLGFSGNGRMEWEVAAFVPALDPAVVVIDCLPNIEAEAVRARTGPLVRQLREALPEVPIVLVEDRDYADGWIHAARARRNRDSQAALREAFDALTAAGVDGLHYLDHGRLLGADGDDTVDGSHPSDLGFARQAEGLLEILGPLLDR